MTTTEMTLNEIREKGYSSLIRDLGPIGYVRFIQQFSMGGGDFTVERRKWADSLTSEEIRDLLRRQSGETESSKPE